MKRHLNLLGSGFSHAFSSSFWYHPEHIIWDKSPNYTSDINVHVDNAIIDIPVDSTKKSFFWVAESSGIVTNVISWMRENKEYLEKNFIYGFTYDKTLLDLTNNIKYVTPNWISWIPENERKIYPKTKLVSMIASNKTITEGHRYRQEIIQKFSGKVDHFGSGFRHIPNVIDGFRDYMFSISMENMNYIGCYTEKIINNFCSGTIPIAYCGIDINEIFNPDGIIMFTDDFKIEDLSPELYYSKIDAINENYELAKKLITTEDYFYLNYIKPYELQRSTSENN
jgi:hypothetical protein